jgi:copper chaperone CopZ
MQYKSYIFLSMLLCLLATTLWGEEPTSMTFRVTGLFDDQRPQEFQELMATIPNVELQKLNVETTEATLRFDVKAAIPGAKPAQVLQRLDQQVKTASHGTFGLKAVSTVPREQLEYVEIAVVGLDCRACNLAAYEIVTKIEGVEQATANFKTGLITVKFDKQKASREKIEETLKMRNVTLK